MRTAAFFDMDRTLVRCNTASLWIRFLRRRGEISFLRMMQGMAWMAQYKLALLDMERVTAQLITDLAGSSEGEMAAKCLGFVTDEVLPQIAGEGRRAIEHHRRQGHLLAILSSSTPYVTEPLARHLGIEHVLCTRLEIAEGRFVGRHIRPVCYGQGKVHWAEGFAREREVDLRQSFFYTDSYSDLPMLERVGERRVINPDPRLRRHARKVGWRIESW